MDFYVAAHATHCDVDRSNVIDDTTCLFDDLGIADTSKNVTASTRHPAPQHNVWVFNSKAYSVTARITKAAIETPLGSPS